MSGHDAARLGGSSEVRSRRILLATVSAAALLAGAVTANARPLMGGGSAVAPTTAATNAAMDAVQQAAAVARQSRSSLARAVQAIQAMQAVQSAARSLPQRSVPNGLTAGGLVPDSGLAAAGVANPVSTWVGAKTPVQTASNGQTTVTLEQTQQKAILNWSSFNVGQNTTLYFNQSAGTAADGSNGWVALNRVNDPSGVPSQILGRVKAEGSVYVINQNGIVFGGSSQINVNTLIASSLNLFSNDLTTSNNRFLNGGIGDLNSSNVATNSVLLTTDKPGVGALTVVPGASINTGTQGFALLAAPNVTNSGTITAPNGQVALIAGIGVSYDYNKSSFNPATGVPQGTNDNATTNLRFANYGKLVDAGGQDITPVGRLVNEGLIYTPGGNITLVGGSVEQNGVAIATTTVSRPGSIVVVSQYEAGVNSGSSNPADLYHTNFYTGSVSFGPNAITAILPDSGGASLPSDLTSLAPFKSVTSNASFTASLPTQGPGVIQIIGQAIDFRGGTMVYAPGQGIGANVVVLRDPRASVPPVAGAGRILLESGAVLDVSGIPDVVLPAASNLLTVVLGGNELADSPLQQASWLYGQTITVDMGQSGINPLTGEAWVGTPLANLTSYANLTQNSIGQLLVNGGTISLTANEVVGAPGSIINLTGGYVHYTGGMIYTSMLLGADGRRYSVGNADPNMTYVGFAGQFTVQNTHWGIKQVYTNPLYRGGYYQPDYLQGGNAGTLSIMVAGANGVADSGATILQSTLLAQAIAGTRQVAGGVLPNNGTFNFTGISPIELTDPNAARAAASTPAGFDMSSPLLAANGSGYTTNVFNTQVLNDGNFRNISFTAGPTGSPAQPIIEDAGAQLTVQPGGSISLTGASVTINGALTARGGAISITSTTSNMVLGGTRNIAGDILIGTGAVLDVSGFFINEMLLPWGEQAPALPINGGSIALVAKFGDSETGNSTTTISDGDAIDLSGNITLAAGSVLNLSGGGHVLRSGKLALGSNGVPLGTSGSLTLKTYDGLTRPLNVNASLPMRGVLTLDGTIEALGFNGGGTLTLQQAALQIGGDPATTPSYGFYFDTGHWGDLGFGSFVLSSTLSAKVPDGAIVRLQHRNLVLAPDAAARVAAATSASVFATPGLLIGTQRSATNLSITAGFEQRNNSFALASADDAAQVGSGAQILGDPGAAISISSYAMTIVDGRISAPGGSISLTVNAPASSGMAGALYLGANTVLDVSGTIVVDPQPAPVFTAGRYVTPLKGQILAGGTVTLSDDNTSILVAPGAVIDVSGAAGAFDVARQAPGGRFGGQQVVLDRTPVWSDAGQVNIVSGTGLLFAGSLIGKPGAAQAAGGTLSITGREVAGSTPKIILVQDTEQAVRDANATFDFATYVPALQAAGGITQQIDPNIPQGTLLLGADRLNGSGFDNLVVNNTGGSVGFAGQVSLSLANSVTVNTFGILAANAGNYAWSYFFGPTLPTTVDGNPTTYGASLTINAPYVAINGYSGSVSTGTPTVTGRTYGSDGRLTVNASQIDLSAITYLSNIGDATFNSTGEIRLLPAQFIPTGTSLVGYLGSAGNLTFNAAVVYPATDTAFVIQALANGSSPTTVTFGYPNGAGPSAGTPLSAGGTLLVSASTIIQNGQIQAPFGSIILGTNAGSSAIGDALGGNISAVFSTAVNTDTVVLGSGSITSVSGNGGIIPFGATVDQATWIYNPLLNNPDWVNLVTSSAFANPLTQAPQRVVTLHGSSVTFSAGAAVNISGGGDLQAQEWIPGTGGSRDVLSQYNTSYANSSQGTKVPLYPDARQIYAILPSYGGKVAPYDAMLSQPGMVAGQQVYLAGGPGLPAAYYTLLPAKYATLPGAYRVVVNSGVTNPLSNQTFTLPDGTLAMTGYFNNGFTGAHGAATLQFYVQSASTWSRYSQYVTNSANSFFPNYARLNNLATPYVPVDAGRLVLAATTGLILDGKLLGDPGAGGFGSQVDVSSQYIEIIGKNGTADPGYLGIEGSALSNLGASSILIGGTRSITSDGTVITPTANGVIVANDAGDPLKAPEILLVAAPQFQTVTIPIDNNGDVASILMPVADTGTVTIRSGSVVQATGATSSAQATKFILGSTLKTLPNLPTNAVVTNATTQFSGTADIIANYYKTLSAALGTVLRVSTGAVATIQLPSQKQISPGTILVKDNLTPSNPDFTITLPSLLGTASGTGAVIEAGAWVDGGNVLTMVSTGDVQVQSGASLSGTHVTATSSSVTFTGAGAMPPTSGFVIDAAVMAELAKAQTVDLQSYGAVNFAGDVDLRMSGIDGQTLTLGGGALSGDGGRVTIVVPTLVLNNTMNAPAVAASGTGSLSIDVGQLVFADGNKALSGFGSVGLAAHQAVIGRGSGSMDFGALPIGLQTPTIIAASGSSQTLVTSGALAALAIDGTAPIGSTAQGGAIALKGASVSVAIPIQAQAGNIRLEATAGDVTVTGALIAHGIAKTFVDRVEYASGGAITLSADHGTVNIEPGALVNFAGAASGGNGGSLTVATSNSTAPVKLAGTFLGATAAGYAGSAFNLDIGGAAVLDDLVSVVNGAGVTGGISVHTGQGDLTLNRSLTATQVRFVADGGLVTVNGSIAANGTNVLTGQIDLYGARGVDIEGSLLATGSPNSPKRGGLINIGTSGTGSATSLDPTYGYENIDPSASGVITIGVNAVIDAAGGAVTLRAPLLSSLNADGINVNVKVAPTAKINGGTVALNAYAVWSTTDQSTDPNKHFDGIVDPAGWYDASGKLVAGNFTDGKNNVIAAWDGTTLTNLDGTTQSLNDYLANGYFAPSSVNANHAVFYGGYDPNSETFDPANPRAGSLPAFVQNPGLQLGTMFSGVANFVARPEIDLVNPSTTVNNGNISVLTNWNLGAGIKNGDGSITHAYRYQGTVAPVIALRAAGNVEVKASITDGFFQTNAVVLPPDPASTPYLNSSSRYQDNLTNFPLSGAILFDGVNFTIVSISSVDGGVNLTAPLTNQTSTYYSVYNTYASRWSSWYNVNSFSSTNAFSLVPTASVAPSLSAYPDYATFLAAYINWEQQNFPNAPLPSSYGTYAAYLTAYSAYYHDTSAFPTDHTNTATPAPPIPPSDKTQYAPTASTGYLGAWRTYLNYLAGGNLTTSDGNSIYAYAPIAPQPDPGPPPVPTPAPVSANAPSNMRTPADPLPVQFASLVSGDSASYRIVAGALVTSPDPLALTNVSTFAAGSPSGLAGSGNVLVDGHTAVTQLNNSGAVLVAPTAIRTGVGSIDIAAGNNFELLDPLAPGVVYTAGTPVAPAAGGDTSSIALGAGAWTPTGGANARIGVSTIVTPQVNADNAGNISLTVQGDIIGIEKVTDTLANTAPWSGVTSGISNNPGAFIGQFWLPWLLTNPANPSVPWYVNFGSFGQGIMSVGGNVAIRAGGNIRDLGVSLATTAYLDGANALHVTGGGNLSVTAGGSIYSGDFYVGRGAGRIAAGGAIVSDITYDGAFQGYPVPTLLAVQYGTIDVEARQTVDIGGVFDPTYLWRPGIAYVNSYPVASYLTASATPINLVPYVTSMSADSGVSIRSVGGDVIFNSLLVQAGVFGLGQNAGASNGVDPTVSISSLLLPASLKLASLNGNIRIDHGGGLYPSTTGALTILADQSVAMAVPLQWGLTPPQGALQYYFPAFPTVGNVSGTMLGKLDYPVGTGILPTASNPTLVDASQLPPSQLHDPALAQGGGAPGTIYALNGSIFDGAPLSAAVAVDGRMLLKDSTGGQIALVPNQPMQIYAGLDILDMPFYGENFTAADITSIIAGRDITYNIKGNQQVTAIELAGPGTLDIEAGRNINFQTQRTGAVYLPQTGVRTIGNAIDTAANPDGLSRSAFDTSTFPFDFGNPYLPAGGASVSILFGIAPGLDQPAFVDHYINPGNAAALAPASQQMLIDFVGQYEKAVGNAASAPLTASQAWTIFQTLPAARQRLLVEQVLVNILDATGKDYNDASSPFYHQYERGYQAIGALFPARLGYTANSLNGANGAATQVATGSFDMRGSTVQTQQGGNVIILGPGGRILVGSSVASPSVDPASEGILTLERGHIATFTDGDVLVAQSRIMTEQGGDILMWSSNGNLDAGKGAKTSVSAPPPRFTCDIDWICSADIKGVVSGAGIATLQSLPNVPVGNANLIAPRGTVDAGAAGIRASGNLNIAALRVLNAFNITVQGTAVGIPTVPVPNISGALTANNAAAANQQDAKPAGQSGNGQPSIIIVEVLGFGGDAGDGGSGNEDQKRGQQGSRTENTNNSYQVLGAGDMTADEARRLISERRRQMPQ
ncbi:filamentous hemagglutinin family protein [Microbacteriaceae bacterium K1510]|nr:filamentous hemagglutinin family protein [Microbacteriaceae bacterium K1510]